MFSGVPLQIARLFGCDTVFVDVQRLPGFEARCRCCHYVIVDSGLLYKVAAVTPDRMCQSTGRVQFEFIAEKIVYRHFGHTRVRADKVIAQSWQTIAHLDSAQQFKVILVDQQFQLILEKLCFQFILEMLVLVHFGRSSFRSFQKCYSFCSSRNIYIIVVLDICSLRLWLELIFFYLCVGADSNSLLSLRTFACWVDYQYLATLHTPVRWRSRFQISSSVWTSARLGCCNSLSLLRTLARWGC